MIEFDPSLMHTLMHIIALLGICPRDEMLFPSVALRGDVGLQSGRVGGPRDECWECDEGNLHLP